MNNPFLEPAAALSEGQPNSLQLATVAGVYEDGLSLIPDAQAEATQKHYKYLSSAYPSPAVGDRVVVMKMSGTYVVMGALGGSASLPAANTVYAGPASGDAAAAAFRSLVAADLPVVPINKGGTGNTGVVSTTTIDDIITAGSEFTVTGAQYCAWGKVAMIFLLVSVNSETTSSAWHTVGTLQSGKRPACHVYTNELNNNEGSLLTTGDLRVWGKFTSGKKLEFTSIYLLA